MPGHEDHMMLSLECNATGKKPQSVETNEAYTRALN